MNTLLDSISVEIVVRNRQGQDADLWTTVTPYLFFEAEGKTVARVPHNWEGFKNGVALELMKKYEKSVYFALSFFTHSDKVQVMDFDGTPIEGYDTVINNETGKRYLKKKMVVVNWLNKDERLAEVAGFVLNLKFQQPVVRILDCRITGNDGWSLLKLLSTRCGNIPEVPGVEQRGQPAPLGHPVSVE